VKQAILAGTAAVWLLGMTASAASDADTLQQLVALERQAMDGWIKGDPAPALAILDPEVTYFHIMTESRLDGLPAVKALFENYRGRPLFESYEIASPKAQVSGDIAVLTYVFVWHAGGNTSRWNSTQIYRKTKEGWRVIHSHWSQTRPNA